MKGVDNPVTKPSAMNFSGSYSPKHTITGTPKLPELELGLTEQGQVPSKAATSAATNANISGTTNEP